MPRIMNEAIDKEDFDRIEKGLPPRPKVVEEKPDPAPPKVENRLELKNISIEDVTNVLECRRRSVRNDQKVIFIGYDLTLKMKKETVSGWMPENEFITFRRAIGTRINTSSIEM